MFSVAIIAFLLFLFLRMHKSVRQLNCVLTCNRAKAKQAKRAGQALGKACCKVKTTTKSCASRLKTFFTLPACCKGSATLD